MIISFRDEVTESIFNGFCVKSLSAEIVKTAYRKLWVLNSAESLNDLKIPPSNHLEKLQGNRNGQFSIRINKQWRICFTWKNGNAYNVEIVDYH